MKIKTILRSAALASAVALVAACGGSDDESGSLTSFNIVPDSVTVQGCGSDLGGSGTRVYVYGGAGPYSVDNTFPDGIAIDRTSVGSQGDYFTVWFAGGCFTDLSVVVTDSFGRQAVLTLTNEPAE